MTSYDELPKRFRPPRMWPTLAIGVLTLGLSVWAVLESWQASAEVERNTDSIAEARGILCDRERVWLSATPETPLEESVRDHIAKTHAACAGL